MFEGLGQDALDIARIVALTLPGFLAVSMFENVNPALARDRSQVQWAMWSLAVSLLLYACLYGIYSVKDWPRKPLDPEFFVALIMLSVAGGYASGRAAGSERGRTLTAKLKLFIPAWVWVEVIRERRWAVVHLTDDTIMYGYPSRFTDDKRETSREIYLEYPRLEFRPYAVSSSASAHVGNHF